MGVGKSVATGPWRCGRASRIRGKAILIPDVLADPEYRAGGYQQAFGFRTILGVPLLRERTTIGVFALTRDEVNPFTDMQIDLVTTFADQAVIAIENVRLFEAEQQRTRELTESLEQQTATSEVLRVIAASPGELSRCLRLCWRTPFASATPNGEPFTAGRATLCNLWRRINYHQRSPKHEAVHRFTAPIRNLFSGGSSRPKTWFTPPILRQSRCTQKNSTQYTLRPWNLGGRGRSWASQ